MCTHPSFGMTTTKALRSVFSWRESIMEYTYMCVRVGGFKNRLKTSSIQSSMYWLKIKKNTDKTSQIEFIYYFYCKGLVHYITMSAWVGRFTRISSWQFALISFSFFYSQFCTHNFAREVLVKSWSKDGHLIIHFLTKIWLTKLSQDQGHPLSKVSQLTSMLVKS